MYLNTNVLKWCKIRLVVKESILFILLNAVGVLIFTLYYPQPISKETLENAVTISKTQNVVFYKLEEKTVLYDKQNVQGYRLLFSGGSKKFYVITYADFSKTDIGTLYEGTEVQFCAVFNGKRIGYVTNAEFYYKPANLKYTLADFKKDTLCDYYTQVYTSYAINYRKDLAYFFVIFSTIIFMLMYILYKIGCAVVTRKYIQRKELLVEENKNVV